MRYSSSEKYEIIQLVQQSSLPVTRTLARLDIHKSTFYNCLDLELFWIAYTNHIKYLLFTSIVTLSGI